MSIIASTVDNDGRLCLNIYNISYQFYVDAKYARPLGS